MALKRMFSAPWPAAVHSYEARVHNTVCQRFNGQSVKFPSAIVRNKQSLRVQSLEERANHAGINDNALVAYYESRHFAQWIFFPISLAHLNSVVQAQLRRGD
ncbi:hypothetical protein ABIF83_007255 [Bradyrhizobium ottawaense]